MSSIIKVAWEFSDDYLKSGKKELPEECYLVGLSQDVMNGGTFDVPKDLIAKLVYSTQGWYGKYKLQTFRGETLISETEIGVGFDFDEGEYELNEEIIKKILK